ncbi:hypothetical protein EDC30_11636 [Paucimonas lemoignei]|uniref:PepSY domain-containing protein n=1 Tax=Paucimonas lemoignei TaxID=29443 RepID=A0A4R3HQR9_PAULE|nr:PepSY domain-containing protein [Paucimonas lemoignei]TCS33505.1 hypothetical protein EDC30_11636 [Paucimonas lemoignei]
MKTSLLKSMTASALLAFSLGAFASSACTDTPRDKWLPQKEIQAKLEKQGYSIKRLKAENSCYEAHVTGKDGKKAELKINPADGAVLKTEEK